jgi:hypothetical protein
MVTTCTLYLLMVPQSRIMIKLRLKAIELLLKNPLRSTEIIFEKFTKNSFIFNSLNLFFLKTYPSFILKLFFDTPEGRFHTTTKPMTCLILFPLPYERICFNYPSFYGSKQWKWVSVNYHPGFFFQFNSNWSLKSSKDFYLISTNFPIDTIIFLTFDRCFLY